MAVKKIHSDRAPEAIGPYSQAIQCGDTLYLSGQIALDPQTMEIVEGGIEEQTKRVFDNLEAVLEAAGATLNDAVKVEVFLKDMNDFQTVNGIYAQHFPREPKPARQAVEVARLPKDVLVEISLVAYLGEK